MVVALARFTMKFSAAKHSIVVAGYKTSVSLEEPFWRGLKNIAQRQETTVGHLVETIDDGRKHGNLSSALRLFVLEGVRSQPTELPEGGSGNNKMNGGQQNGR
jgi:predicted DNA-binding ribbon-helix-helix protein